MASLIYFDQNVFDHLLDAEVSQAEAAAALDKQGYALVISEDNFQEWAACWKAGRPESELRGRSLISYALGLRPKRFLAPMPQILVDEAIAKLKHRSPRPFLSGTEAADATELLQRAALGLNEDDRRKMRKRWEQKEQIAARFADEGRGYPGGHARGGQADSFEAFLAQHKTSQDEVANRVLSAAFAFSDTAGDTAQRTVRHTVRRWKSCPFLRTAVRTNLFVEYQLVNGRAMPHDRWDDLRHCINASRVDVFVTRDDKLRESCRQIRPGARLTTVAELAREIGVQYRGP